MIKKLFLITSISTAIILTGCSQNDESQPDGETQKENTEQTDKQENQEKTGDLSDFLQSFEGTVNHVHGIGYIHPDAGMAFATHSGLKFYQDGDWVETKEQFNDYMGFTAVDNGFYTSGHPGKDSDLPNPLGLKKSTDGGQTLEDLGFEGESDFHTMGVGYNNHAIYLVNIQPNSELDAGFYRSLDDGETWEAIEAAGISTSPFALAVHPTDKNVVAASTQNGIYLSKDGGQTFEPVKENTQGTALYFEEERLYFATYSSEPKLESINLKDTTADTLSLPEIGNQAILYVAKNPDNEDEITLLSSDGEKENAFISTDEGENWKQILDQGKTISK
ncbi:hypothetical protein GCM10007216_11670 [Thalassobacillus devorans]|uniref:Sortilin N-terminal domain-containing protein n=1 Tax=Thalassobacillus devorans TaxID=279813 RepID=A0ABQ1NTB3_9BACI|nr:hypothetical protein [Thalassobacillus devorans]NIK28893.1 hypothetical protein [Thalassobacillus devorans]GGC82803.1 hypothetical protein GCM10007216_11670 [Thalassobacillus devorans]